MCEIDLSIRWIKEDILYFRLNITTPNISDQSKSTIPKLERRIFICSTKSEPVAYSVSIPTANPNIAHLRIF
jgi:hypothetical protein